MTILQAAKRCFSGGDTRVRVTRKAGETKIVRLRKNKILMHTLNFCDDLSDVKKTEKVSRESELPEKQLRQNCWIEKKTMRVKKDVSGNS